jgi:hypothetical protein
MYPFACNEKPAAIHIPIALFGERHHSRIIEPQLGVEFVIERIPWPREILDRRFSFLSEKTGNDPVRCEVVVEPPSYEKHEIVYFFSVLSTEGWIVRLPY